MSQCDGWRRTTPSMFRLVYFVHAGCGRPTVFHWKHQGQITARRKCVCQNTAQTGRGIVFPGHYPQVANGGNSPLRKTKKDDRTAERQTENRRTLTGWSSGFVLESVPWLTGFLFPPGLETVPSRWVRNRPAVWLTQQGVCLLACFSSRGWRSDWDSSIVLVLERSQAASKYPWSQCSVSWRRRQQWYHRETLGGGKVFCFRFNYGKWQFFFKQQVFSVIEQLLLAPSLLEY